LGPIWRTSFKKGCGPLLLTCGSHEVRDDSTVGSANGVERVSHSARGYTHRPHPAQPIQTYREPQCL
jgi:hypothetical protein